jgi:hypothetical protein
MEEIEMIFRIDKVTGEEIAIFPYTIGTLAFDSVGAYVHKGQHFPVDYATTMEFTEPMENPEQCALYKELKQIYEVLLGGEPPLKIKLVKKRNYDRYLKVYYDEQKRLRQKDS